jgi:hypothetical protein
MRITVSAAEIWLVWGVLTNSYDTTYRNHDPIGWRASDLLSELSRAILDKKLRRDHVPTKPNEGIPLRNVEWFGD